MIMLGREGHRERQRERERESSKQLPRDWAIPITPPVIKSTPRLINAIPFRELHASALPVAD